jgi:signal recognition particle subunit SRP19
LRRKGRLTLWPAYFDNFYSRRQGRRVPKQMALRGVKVEEILQATEDLVLNPILSPREAYSKHPWLKTGSVHVDKTGPKTAVLKDLAQQIRKNRTKK